MSQDLEVLEDFNKSRLPWFHQGDPRLTRAFQLGKGFDVEVFTSVINFLDIENVAGINPTTGQPNVTGVENQLSQTPLIPGTFKLEGAPDGLPINVDQLVEEFRDEMARQDLDGDGTVTLEEAQTRLRQALQATGSGGIGFRRLSVPLRRAAPVDLRSGDRLLAFVGCPDRARTLQCQGGQQFIPSDPATPLRGLPLC